MASSAHEQHHHHHLRTPYGATAAPPPTPSSQPNLSSTASGAAADALSLLLHRLPPSLSLSLPSRRSPLSTKTAAVPSVSLSEPTELLSASEKLGFFQLTDHSIPSELANSAESLTRSLFDLPRDKKQLYFPKNWPLGFNAEVDDDDHTGGGESFCLDSSCSSESTELDLSSLRAFTREMEKLGLEVTEALASVVGFDNPAREDPTRVCSLLWISEESCVSTPVLSGRMYPFVIGLHYQIRCQKYHMLTDSGWVTISPHVDSILVTVGDIAQVWSNGKLQKVRGRAVPANGDDGSRCISMTLLVTLPVDSIVSPLLPAGDEEINSDNLEESSSKEERIFNPFPFEDYAWRIYHERLLHKDPLLRYRV